MNCRAARSCHGTDSSDLFCSTLKTKPQGYLRSPHPPPHSQGMLEGKPLNRLSSPLSLQAGQPPREPQMRAIPVPRCTSAKVPGAARPAAPACRTPAQPLLKISVVQMGHPTSLLQSQQRDRGWDLPHHIKHHPGSRSDELPEAIGMGTSPLTIANCSRGHLSAELRRRRRGPV